MFMKKSIKHLPKRTQEELTVLLDLVCKSVDNCQMIILFGSYARGNYVLWDTKIEIGVMKVLGCDMGNIRSMFLIESGFIGFMGGVLGALLSYGVSIIVNRFVSMSDMMGMSGNLSRIPLWLAFAAIGFAIFVGMAAGFMPAMRAMKLSPLAAIRNE